MSIIAAIKNAFRKKSVSDGSVESMKKEIAILMAELKKLYERNAELTRENDKLSAAAKK